MDIIERTIIDALETENVMTVEGSSFTNRSVRGFEITRQVRTTLANHLIDPISKIISQQDKGIITTDECITNVIETIATFELEDEH